MNQEIINYIEENQYGKQKTLIDKFGKEKMMMLYSLNIITLHQNKDKTNTYKISNNHIEYIKSLIPNNTIEDNTLWYLNSVIVSRYGVFKVIGIIIIFWFLIFIVL